MFNSQRKSRQIDLLFWKGLLFFVVLAWSLACKNIATSSTAARNLFSSKSKVFGIFFRKQNKNPLILYFSINFNEERISLTIEYRQLHQDKKINDILIEPQMIILHHTNTHSLIPTWNYFNRSRINKERKELAQEGDVNVSAHFLVDRDGTIYQLMPETWMARHCIGLNHVAIGIENIGDLVTLPLTTAQLHANVALIRYLVKKYPITHVIGHHEAGTMVHHPYFQELNIHYRTQKSDPGDVFMKQIRTLIADLKLQGPLGF